MQGSVEHVAEVPEAIRRAERWRLAGEELRRLAPEVFARLVELLVIAKLGNRRDSDDGITKSYFLT